MIDIRKINRADIIGIASSSLCLVHCIATPLLVALGMNFMLVPIVKPLFIIIAWFSISKATDNATTGVSLLLWTSFFGFIIASFFHERYEWLQYAEYVFSTLIVAGHILNIKYGNHCSDN